jgi:hypothetical protein
MIEQKKESWVFCYWDEPLDKKPNKKQNEDKNNTGRKKGSDKT